MPSRMTKEQVALNRKNAPSSGVERSDRVEDPLFMPVFHNVGEKTRIKSGEIACITLLNVYIFAQVSRSTHNKEERWHLV